MKKTTGAAVVGASAFVLLAGAGTIGAMLASRGADAAAGNPPARMAKLTFTLVSEGSEGGKAQNATAMLVLPAPPGATSTPILRSSYSSYSRAEPQPEGEGTAVWLEKSVPATRVTAIVRTRDDGRLWISYEIELLDDAGSLPGGQNAPATRLVNGASLSGQVILPNAGGKATVGELRDRKGRHLTVDLDGTALDVN